MKLLGLYFRKFTLMIVMKGRLKQLGEELPCSGVLRNVCRVILVSTATGKCH